MGPQRGLETDPRLESWYFAARAALLGANDVIPRQCRRSKKESAGAKLPAYRRRDVRSLQAASHYRSVREALLVMPKGLRPAHESPTL